MSAGIAVLALVYTCPFKCCFKRTYWWVDAILVFTGVANIPFLSSFLMVVIFCLPNVAIWECGRTAWRSQIWERYTHLTKTSLGTTRQSPQPSCYQSLRKQARIDVQINIAFLTVAGNCHCWLLLALSILIEWLRITTDFILFMNCLLLIN